MFSAYEYYIIKFSLWCVRRYSYTYRSSGTDMTRIFSSFLFVGMTEDDAKRARIQGNFCSLWVRARTHRDKQIKWDLFMLNGRHVWVLWIPSVRLSYSFVRCSANWSACELSTQLELLSIACNSNPFPHTAQAQSSRHNLNSNIFCSKYSIEVHKQRDNARSILDNLSGDTPKREHKYWMYYSSVSVELSIYHYIFCLCAF